MWEKIFQNIIWTPKLIFTLDQFQWKAIKSPLDFRSFGLYNNTNQFKIKLRILIQIWV